MNNLAELHFKVQEQERQITSLQSQLKEAREIIAAIVEGYTPAKGLMTNRNEAVSDLDRARSFLSQTEGNDG